MSLEQNKINEGLAGDAYKIFSLAKMAKGRVSAAVAQKKVQDTAKKKEEEEKKEVEEENFKMNTKSRSLNKFDTAYEGTMSKLYEPLTEEEKEKGFLGKAWDTAKTVAGAAALVGGGIALGNPALRGKIGDALKGAWKGGKTGAKGLAARRLTDAGAGAAQQAALTTPGAQAKNLTDVENAYGIPQEPAGAARIAKARAEYDTDNYLPDAPPVKKPFYPTPDGKLPAPAKKPFYPTPDGKLPAPATKIGPANDPRNMKPPFPGTRAAASKLGGKISNTVGTVAGKARDTLGGAYDSIRRQTKDAIKLNTPGATRHGTGPARPTGTPSPGGGVSPTPPTGKPYDPKTDDLLRGTGAGAPARTPDGKFSDRRIGGQGKTPSPTTMTPEELRKFNKDKEDWKNKMPKMNLDPKKGPVG